MHKLTRLQSARWIAGGALLLFANLACAQYAWIDEKGLRQFSDRAPPASVPLKNILRSPVPIVIAADGATPSVPGTVTASPKAPVTLAEREADYRRRKLEKDHQDKVAEALAANLAQRKIACDSARANKAQLAAGGRLRTPNGVVMDDKMIAAEQGKVNGYLNECNK